jgi:transcriptional regulator with XRE-family HTH domain
MDRVETADIEALMRARRLAESGMARSIRLAADLSIEEVAGASDAGISSVSRWERGLRRPHGAAAIRWARVMDEIARAS